MGQAVLTKYGLENIVLYGVANRNFYLQPGTGVPSGGKEGGAVGSRIQATKTLTPGGGVIVRFSGIHTASSDRTIQSIGLYNTATGGTCMGYLETKLVLIASQKGELKFTLNHVGA